MPTRNGDTSVRPYTTATACSSPNMTHSRTRGHIHECRLALCPCTLSPIQVHGSTLEGVSFSGVLSTRTPPCRNPSARPPPHNRPDASCIYSVGSEELPLSFSKARQQPDQPSTVLPEGWLFTYRCRTLPRLERGRSMLPGTVGGPE